MPMDISTLRDRPDLSPLTVSELNEKIKHTLESDPTLSRVTVRGEISNFVRHGSGHLYFTLKDTEGQIRCVMFRSAAMRLRFAPSDGMKVQLRGGVSVYTRGGAYQLYVESMEPDGIGALYLAYEQLKERLAAEGLFDEEHKRPLPRVPRRIGVITSPTGAAVRDIIHVTGRRFPLAQVYLYPSLVQGDGAADNLIRAIDYFDRSHLVDVVIIGRGGGSLEDLWAFNNEALARRIYDATVPIISAVGHETDFTICDFVSDLRAPTPSAAAELAVPDVRELCVRLDSLADAAVGALTRVCERRRHALDIIRNRPPLASPELLLERRRRATEELFARATSLADRALADMRGRLVPIVEKLDALSPLATMRRGFSVITKNGRSVKSVADIEIGDEFDIRLFDGSATAQVIRKDT